MDDEAITGWAWLEKRVGGAHDYSLRIHAADHLAALRAYDAIVGADGEWKGGPFDGCDRSEYVWRKIF